MYVLEGIGLTISIQKSYYNFNFDFKKHYNRVLLLVFMLIHIILILSLFKFGEKIEMIVFYSYVKSSKTFLLITIIYMSSVFIGFPQNLFPVYDIVEKYIKVFKHKRF